MEIDFKALETDLDVKQALETYLPVKQSMHSDVVKFLETQNLTHSGLISDKGTNAVIAELMQEPFDSRISCRVAAPPERGHQQDRVSSPWAWFRNWIDNKLVSYEYFIDFHFSDELLVEIVVAKIGTGL